MNGPPVGGLGIKGAPVRGVGMEPPIHSMLLADVIFGAGLQGSSLRA